MPVPSSPCVKICILDDASKLCRGCGRSLDEIVGWGGMDEAARRAIMRRLARRMTEAGLQPVDAAAP